MWLGNFRGTLYSRRHVYLSDSDVKYWNFGPDEHGTLDLPAQIDLVHNVTLQKIIYIGYSLGSGVSYMYSTVNPEEAHEKLKVLVSIAPGIFFRGWTMSKYFVWLWPYVEVNVYCVHFFNCSRTSISCIDFFTRIINDFFVPEESSCYLLYRNIKNNRSQKI